MSPGATPEQRLAALGLTVPPAPGAVAAYEPWARTGDLVLTSFQLPWCDGALLLTGPCGPGGHTAEQGYDAARQCALNGIAQLREAADGDLSRVTRILRLEGHVFASPGFADIPRVLNGASELINAVFAEAGRHSRTALGHQVMPLDATVMIGFWAEVAP